MLARFNLNGLVALDALMRHSTLTAAARSIHLSQPAMSIALKRLRETFDDELVRYDRGAALLTPFAEEIRPQVISIIAQSQSLIRTARSFDPKTFRGVITLCAPQSTLGFFQAPLIAVLATTAPGMSIRGITYPPPESLDERVDIYIVPEWLAPAASSYRRLFVEQFSCLVPAEWVGNGIDEATFLDRAHAALPAGEEEIFWPGDSPARALFSHRRVVARAAELDALPFLVVRNDLIATMTARAAQQQCARSTTVPITAPPVLADVVLVAYAGANRSNEAALRWLLKTIEQLAMPFNPPELMSLLGIDSADN